MVKYQPLDMAITTGHWRMAGEKTEESSVSHESGKGGMSGQTAKVTPGPAPPPQGPGGRFRGTCEPGPSGNGA